jgi:peptide/nickel transport system permease protein
MNQRMLNNLRTQLVENKFAIFSIIVLLVLVSSTLLASLSSYDPNKINILSALLPPDAKHFFWNR